MDKNDGDSALRAFKALRSDVEQFDDQPENYGDIGHFSSRVPLYMKSYLVNWLRKFMAEHGDDVEAMLVAEQFRTYRIHSIAARETGDGEGSRPADPSPQSNDEAPNAE